VRRPAARLATLRATPDAALTIDTETFPWLGPAAQKWFDRYKVDPSIGAIFAAVKGGRWMRLTDPLTY